MLGDVFLGVDWYFVDAFESVSAGEVFVLLVFGVVGWIVLRQNLVVSGASKKVEDTLARTHQEEKEKECLDP